MSGDSVYQLRASLHKAKSDLDSIARRLEQELAAQSSTGAPLHNLLKSVVRLEADVGVLEAEYGEVQTAKRELLECSKTLIENWMTLQRLRCTSGLPKEKSESVEGLQETVHTVKHELEKCLTETKPSQDDYLADL